MRCVRQFAVLTITLGAVLAVLTGAQEKAPRPNIVYIVSDDQGWKDVGYHGSDIKTPRIDQLAAQNPQKVAELQ